MNETRFSTLADRTKSAVIIGLVSIALLTFGKMTNFVFLGLIGLLCFWEFLQLKRNHQESSELSNWIPQLLSIIFLAISIYMWNSNELHTFFKIICWIGIVYSLLGIFNLYTPISFFKKNVILNYHIDFYILIPIIVALYVLKYEDPFEFFILKLVVLIWSSDSFAYLVGSQWGRRKLFPSVSPNKSIEGFLGGVFFTLCISLVIASLSVGKPYLSWLMIASIVIIFGTYGDLFQSKLKRLLQIKDTGNVFKGHGGFLDRYDSFLFIWPYIGLLKLFEII